MKNCFLVKKYIERYSIPAINLVESGERNRIIVLIASIGLFIFGIGDVAAIFLIFHANLAEQINRLIYFGSFAVSGTFGIIYSKQIKNVPKEKAYFLKTIPVYIIMITSMCAALYNFYILDQPFNGFLAFCLTGFLMLCLFSFSPVPFFFALLITLGLLIPGLYKHFKLSGLADSILCAILMFYLSLYKRRIEKNQILLLNKQKQNLEAKTFGNFTLLYENKVVKFTRTKSNELLAYLVYKNGSSVNTKELIAILYSNQADIKKSGSNLRNLIVDIKQTFQKLNIQNFFIAEYNNFRINPEIVKCDYYDFLSGDEAAINNYAGEFMNQYSWAEETAGFLEMKLMKALKK